MKIGRKVPPHGGNGKLPGGIPVMRPHHKDGLNTDRTGKPVTISESSIHLWHESQKEFGAQFIVIISVTVNAVPPSPTGGVKSTSPDTENHDKHGYAKLYDDNNLFMTNVDNSDTTYTNKHKNTEYNVRNM